MLRITILLAAATLMAPASVLAQATSPTATAAAPAQATSPTAPASALAQATSPTPAPTAYAAPAAGDTVTLPQVYTLARARNPRLAAALAVADASAARVPGAGLPPDPSLQVGVMNLSLPSLSANMPSAMAPQIQLMQMLPTPGKLGLSKQIARDSASMAGADARETWWEVRSSAAMAFYDVYAADRQLAVMQKTVRLLEDFRKVAQAMYASGEGRQSDVLRAGVEVAKMQAEITRMQAMRTAAVAKLNAALDRPAESVVPAVALPALPAAVPGLDTLAAWADSTRPMLAKGRTAIDQARAQSQLARKEIWPDLSVGLAYGQRPGEMGTERMASAMVGFTIPVFAGSRQLKMREEAAAMSRMATADLGEMRAQVRSRLGEITADLERDRTLVALYRSQVLPQAQANVQSVLSSYRVGQVDFMTLVDAQMTANQYEQELYAMLGRYGASLAELEMTIGREVPAAAQTLAEAK